MHVQNKKKQTWKCYLDDDAIITANLLVIQSIWLIRKKADWQCDDDHYYWQNKLLISDWLVLTRHYQLNKELRRHKTLHPPCSEENAKAGGVLIQQNYRSMSGVESDGFCEEGRVRYGRVPLTPLMSPSKAALMSSNPAPVTHNRERNAVNPSRRRRLAIQLPASSTGAWTHGWLIKGELLSKKKKQKKNSGAEQSRTHNPFMGRAELIPTIPLWAELRPTIWFMGHKPQP